MKPITTLELQRLAAYELGSGPGTRALDAHAEWDSAKREAEELEGVVTMLREQLACREQDLQIAQRSRLEAGRTYRVRCEQVRRG